MIKGISFVLGLSLVCGAIACSGEDPQSESAATDGTAGASSTVDPATSDLRRRRSGTGGIVASTGVTTVVSTGGTTVVSTGGTTVVSTGGTTVTSTGGATVTSTGGTTSTTSTAVACPPAAPSTATIYYACDCVAGADKDCVAGNDTNTGTSASAPWRSFERARSQFASLRAGDRIEFCKGGRFTSTTNGKW